MPSMVKTVLPVLAAASTAYAACSTSATVTLQNAGDATALAGACQTFTGNIAIATGTTEDIALDGLRQLSGNLIVQDAPGVRRVGGADLEVALDMTFNNLTRLAGVSFPKLKQIGALNLVGLPALTEFSAQIDTAKSIRVQNTNIQSLSSIDLSQADMITLADNRNLKEFTMSLANVSKAITIAGSGGNLKVDLPNLGSAANITYRSCSSVSMPSLQTVAGSLGFYDNGFDSISFANLTGVGSAVALVANNKLTNASFPVLTKIGGNLQVANNTALQAVNGFPVLETVSASMDVFGVVNDVETPALKFINGTFNLQSTDNVDCSFYQKLHDSKKIGGTYFCQGKLQDPGANGHKPTAQGTGKGNAGTALSPINGALALAAMVAVMIF